MFKDLTDKFTIWIKKFKESDLDNHFVSVKQS